MKVIRNRSASLDHEDTSALETREQSQRRRRKNRRAPWRRRYVRLGSCFLLSLLAGMFVLSACSLGPDVTGEKTPTVMPARLSMTHRPQLTIEIAPDITGSYEQNLRSAFVSQMADWLDDLPRVNSEKATVYVTAINSEPYAPSSTIVSFTVDNIDNWPATPQPTPVPSCPVNPYECSNAQTAAIDANNAAQSQYQQGLVKIQTKLKQVQNQTAQQVAPLLSWHPAVDNRSTSIYGVLNLASQRFSGQSGDHWLLIASDLLNNSGIDQIIPDLTGTHVLVMYLETSSAKARQNLTSTWTWIFRQAHVASVRFLDPGESRVMTCPWA